MPFPHFIKKPARATIVHCMSDSVEDITHEERNLTSNWQAVNYLLNPYATDDVNVRLGADVTNYEQPVNMCAVHYS